MSMADTGARVRIVSLMGGGGHNKRMTDMGLNVGAELAVQQRESAGLVVVRGETRFALGIGMAHRVIVTPAITMKEIPG